MKIYCHFCIYTANYVFASNWHESARVSRMRLHILFYQVVYLFIFFNFIFIRDKISDTQRTCYVFANRIKDNNKKNNKHLTNPDRLIYTFRIIIQNWLSIIEFSKRNAMKIFNNKKNGDLNHLILFNIPSSSDAYDVPNLDISFIVFLPSSSTPQLKRIKDIIIVRSTSFYVTA